MAMANVADILSRKGLRVLMIDFDLEAPGLEQFFQIDQRAIRCHEGLLDLLLSYKSAMSKGSDESESQFKNIKAKFIVPVYNNLPSSGCLDLLPAGKRESDDDLRSSAVDEQLTEYALNLRKFDWQDFYFNWAGEAFFEWLRKLLFPELYDVVLVDSRTGVTEMGGICAYQLADTIVMLCAPNHQNMDGTRNMAKNFFSPRVRGLRGGRPLQVIVVPARIEQRDEAMLELFRKRFEEDFHEYTGYTLRSDRIKFWDLMIPYEARYAFEEQVVSRPLRINPRHHVGTAFQKLANALSQLAEPGTRLAALNSEGQNGDAQQVQIEPQYDIRRRFAGYDTCFCYSAEDKKAVSLLARQLQDKAGLHVFFDQWDLMPGESWTAKMEEAVRQSRSCTLVLGHSQAVQNKRFLTTLQALIQETGFPVIPILLPDTQIDFKQLPDYIGGLTWVDFHDGLDDLNALQRLIDAIQNESVVPDRTNAEIGIPYPGLQAFNEHDAAFYFGRESVIQDLIEDLQNSRFKAVVGPSGWGKSSLVCAGLFPALRQGELPGSANWLLQVVRPGTSPIESLATAINSVLQNSDPAAIHDRMEILLKTESGLYDSVREVLASKSNNPDSGERRLILFIDQFEEIFTLCDDESQRKHFIRSILHASHVAQGLATIILALRSDFISECLRFRAFAAELQSHMLMLSPMSREQLRQAIEKPAQRAGLAFEPGLIETILDDVESAPGALPLFQFLLRELWERRRAGWLTVQAYHECGGVSGAIANRAEEVFSTFSLGERLLLQRIMLRLVRLGEGVEETRSRATVSEFVTQTSERADVEKVISDMVRARLFMTGGDERTPEIWVEISHEALIRNWPRLRAWIDQDREALRIWRRITQATHEWQNLGKDASVLYRGERLAQAVEGQSRLAISLNESEREFLEASQSLEKRTRTRSRVAAASLVLGILIFATLALVSIVQYQNARSQMHLAQEQRILAERSNAEAQEQTIKARQLEQEQSEQRAQAEKSRLEADEQREFAERQKALAELRYRQTEEQRAKAENLTKQIIIASQTPGSAVSPDGTRLFTSSRDGTFHLLDTKTQKKIFEGKGVVEDTVFASFSPNSKLLATISKEAFGIGQVTIWDSYSGRALGQFTYPSTVNRVVFSRNGDRLAIAYSSGVGTIYDLRASNGVPVRLLLGQQGPMTDISFSPDGKVVMTYGANGKKSIWDATTGNLLKDQ